MRAMMGIIGFVLAITSRGADFPEVPQLCLRLQIGGSQGSGFFMKRSNDCYIITAKHVVYTNDGTLFTTNSSLFATNMVAEFIWPAATTNLWRFSIDLVDAIGMGHVKVNAQRVVCAVKWGISELGTNTSGNIKFYRFCSVEQPSIPGRGITLPNADYAARFDMIEPGADIYMVGYPSDVGIFHPQVERTRPLLA